MKEIKINGKVGNTTFSNLAVNAFILGFNHNSAKEGANKIHFQIGKIGSTAVGLCDSQYNNTTSSSGYFNWNTSNTNSGGWNACYKRKTLYGNDGTPTSPVANSLMAALPSELLAVMQPVTKYTDNTGNSSNTSGAVTATTDYLFDLSVMDNIRMGRKGATDEQVIAAAKKCGCHEFIMSLEHGYQTVCGVSGGHLSGGERQRISIARALMKDAPILILDDSVSAVDTKTEKAILDNLRATRAGKTTILIAHRISTIEQMDKILFIEDGRLAGFDTHDKLYTENPAYRKMVDLQRLEEEGGAVNA